MSESRTGGTFPSLAAKLLGVHWLMRVPIALYRVRLGFLLGRRFLLLEHRGRVSGRPRLVVLEVIGRPAPDSYLVVSGFGTRAQWYQNVRATPRVRIASGARGLRPAHAHMLGSAEGPAALESYAKAHPKAWASFRSILDQTLAAPAHTVPVVRLDLLPEQGEEGRDWA